MVIIGSRARHGFVNACQYFASCIQAKRHHDFGIFPSDFKVSTAIIHGIDGDG